MRRTGTNAFAVKTAPMRLTAKNAQAVVGAPRNIGEAVYPFLRRKRLASGRGFSIARVSSVTCMIDVIS